MRVIPLDRKRKGRTIRVPLPNGEIFFASEDDMHALFDDPSRCLKEGEKEGLLQLALAVVFADHKHKKAAGSSR